ncbi:MAG: hypothetical protein FJY54_05900 [Betaproteobacteria bacterium]|nr:hypothetical protein [Betaproteobacteria bacterium]
MKVDWKSGIVALMVTAALAFPAPAQETKKREKEKPHSAAEVKEDIANHRAMADAHLAAAKCLEAGKTVKECHAQLAKDCKGLGIGKYCGMKHRH